MHIETIQVQTETDIKTVVQLAGDIWREHFTPIIGRDQVEYMLKKYQSEQAIQSQIDEAWVYYLFKSNGKFIAYIALVLEPNINKLMLSKVYVKKATRGQGIGRFILNYIERKYKDDGYTSLWLTVNRFNNETINWYLNHQFETIDEVKKDIGGGYFMDDYIMEKKL